MTFLLQQKYKKGIFSHETALYLHGFLDWIPNQFIMTFLKGTSTTRMKRDIVRPVVTAIEFEMGIMTLERAPSNIINLYNPERTLVDIFRPKYNGDFEQLIPTFKRYAQRKNKDINKLYQYATIFNVEEKIRNYMGCYYKN